MATVLLVSNYGASTYDFGYNGTLLAQTFTMPSGYDRLDYVKLKLKRLGTVSGNVTASIYATSGGYPTGGALASASFSASSVSTASGGGVYTFDFTDLAVTAGTKYAIVLSHSGTSASNNISWYRSGNDYGGGDSFWKYSSGSWTANGYDMYFEAWGYQSAVVPTVTTDNLSGATTSAFTVDGNVSSDGGATITERGAVYSSTNATPTTGDSKQTTTGTTGTMNFAITGLSPGVLYYVRCYATNSQGTAYGDVMTITTSATTPTVTSDSASSISSVSATGYGTASATGGASITERGICWSTTSNPTTSGNKATAGTGTGSFNANMTNLSPNTLYHYRAYAVNSVGTSYGADKTFTTLDQVKYWAQSFTPGVTGTLTKVKLAVKLQSGTSGNLKVRIYTNNAGSPGTVLQTCTTVQVTNTSYQDITILTNVAVTNGTKYWIVIEDPLVVGSFEIAIGASSSGGYASGEIKYTKTSAPTTWINTSHTTDDMAFYAYIQPTITASYNLEIKSKKLYK